MESARTSLEECLSLYRSLGDKSDVFWAFVDPW